MDNGPKLEDKAEQPYMGIRMKVSMRGMNKVIGPSFTEIFEWLQKHNIEPVGAPFVRLHVVNMSALMDIEMGVPVSNAPEGDERVKPGVLPAGKYGSYIYGARNGIKGNGTLLEWGGKNGVAWDKWEIPEGDVFRCRYEAYLTDPKEEPKQANWQIEVAILTAGKPAE